MSIIKINFLKLKGDPRQDDMDIILILTSECYYVAHYDDEVDKVTRYQRILLSNVDKIEFGVPETGGFSFGRSHMKVEHSLRIFYRMPSEGNWQKKEGIIIDGCRSRGKCIFYRLYLFCAIYFSFFFPPALCWRYACFFLFFSFQCYLQRSLVTSYFLDLAWERRRPTLMNLRVSVET